MKTTHELYWKQIPNSQIDGIAQVAHFGVSLHIRDWHAK